MESVQIGSQLFINATDSSQRVKQLVKRMHDYGLTLIRLFLLWDQLEPEEGIWDFSRYDACFDAAQHYKMKVVPTLMAVSPPGWMRLTRGPQSIADLDDPVFWQGRAGNYVRTVVEHYACHPALHSWILWNEPGRALADTPHSRLAFQRLLNEKYHGRIDHLNALYYEQLDNFLQLRPVSLYGAAFESYPQRLDALWAAVDNLDEKLRDLKEWVREKDTVHPIHINPHNVGQNQLPIGQSIWHQAKYVDFLGCSAHIPWHSQRFPKNRKAHSVALYADMMKSATPHPEGLFWVTELQGGPTWFSSPVTSSPTGTEITFWLWEAIGSGARAVLFWCFNSRENGDEAGEWSLLNLLDGPSERLLAVGKVSELLWRYRTLFDNTAPVQPQVLLLDSQSTHALCAIETGNVEKNAPRNCQMAADALCGAYLLCSDLGLSVSIVSEEQFWVGRYPKAKVLILAETTSLDERTIDALLRFQQQGGTVIADGLCGLKDSMGNLAHRYADRLQRLFGMQMVEIRGMEWEDQVLTSEGKKFPTWFVRVDPILTHGKATAVFSDGSPAIVCNRNEKGGAVRILTSFFRQEMLERLEDGPGLLYTFLPVEIFRQPTELLNPSRTLRLRRLIHPKGEVLILLNTAQADTAVLRFSGRGVLSRLDVWQEYLTDGHRLLAYPMAAESVAIFFWQRDKIEEKAQ